MPTNTLLKLLQYDTINRLMKLSFPRHDGPDALLLINELVANECVSNDFEYIATVISDDAAIELKQVQCKLVCIELLRMDQSSRYFNGHCFEFRLLKVENSLAVYQMILRPWLAFFKLRRDHYIFQNKSIEEQTKEIFYDTGLSTHEFRTRESDPKRTYSCQYDETDYNYLHRRWEEMGWHYWYEHTERGHKLILSSGSMEAEMIDGKGTIAWHHDGGSNGDDKIGSWSPVREVVSGKVALSVFDFKTPTPQRLVETSDHEQGEINKIEVYQYQGLYGYKDAGHGGRIAQRRMEAIDAAGKYFEAAGDNRFVQPGRWFTLARDTDSQMFEGGAGENEFFILSTRHVIHNNYLNAGGQHAHYENSFTCLRRYIPWRPQAGYNSEPCTIPGVDTATVVGPKGEEIHTDQYGRIKVQFHWDRKGEFDEKSSAWVRVMTPWAENSFGMITIPRIGSEVVVQYLHGNPDRPLIIGQVYNQRNMPPWALPTNKTQSGILTRSSKGGSPANANALRFEDKIDEEEIWLHAEKNQRIEVEHDEKHWVGHDRHKIIDNDETVEVKHNRREMVGNDETININHNRTETVGHNESISIKQDRTMQVGHNETVSIGKIQATKVGDHLELVCGEAKIVLQKDGGIYLQGTHIEIKGSAAVNIDGGMVFINDGKAKAAPSA